MNSVLSLLNMYSLQVVPASGIPDGWMGLDIGPDSIKTFNESLDTTKTVIWNGPMGVFEFEKFAVGTEVCFHCFHCSYMRHFQFKDFFFFNVENGL
jgi:3-phosphoglycerate kinase